MYVCTEIVSGVTKGDIIGPASFWILVKTMVLHNGYTVMSGMCNGHHTGNRNL